MIRKNINSRKRIIKIKNCSFCKEKKLPGYKEFSVLEKFLSERGKILARSKTGLCSKHQKMLTKAVKRARFLGLLPFAPSVK
ncbi:MAG: 30S ribosomal protein S18 [Microgenomates group bacterium ADurb.Bin219]|nr:MAG: 30S ribosomal protein S18 [Microgenomates group bacterium ADurb.Bin219]HNP89332.1 30S ribosomal protein S18 [Candidatus Woesebacteria bacterium]